MKKLIVIVAVACFSSLYAGVCTWTGKAGDGKWSSPGNWSADPTAADGVEFALGTGVEQTVTVDNPGLTTVQFVKVSSGKLTLRSAGGALLRTTGSAADGSLVVAADAELDLEVPLDLQDRFDKSGAGTVRFRSTVTNLSASTSYLWDGRCVFEGLSDTYFKNAVGLGLGKGARVKVEFVDQAHAKFNNVLTTGLNDNKGAGAELLVDGDDVRLELWRLHLGSNDGPTETDRPNEFVVRRGTVSMTRLRIGDTAPASFRQEGGSVTAGEFILKDDASVAASFEVSGGVFAFNNDNTIVPVFRHAVFQLKGGTLSTKNLTFEGSLAVAGDSTLQVSDKKLLTLQRSVTLAPETVLHKTGKGTVFVKDDMMARGSLAVESGEVCFGVGVTVRNPAGVYTPYPVSVASGATLRMDAVTTRFSLPLDLSLDGTIAMSEGENGYTCRSVLVAHKLKVGGAVKAKGRFNDHLTGGSGCSIVVPYVWTGAAGDNDWNTGANWDGDTVPENADATVVDISRATAPIRLDTEVGIGGLISMPGSGRIRTVAGAGIVSLRICFSYACAAYVEEGSELVLDVGLDKESGNYLTFLGGGKILIKKGFPTGNTTNLLPPFSLDATVALAGPMSLPDTMLLTALAHEKEGRGKLMIEAGASCSVNQIFMCADRDYPLSEIRQTGGAVTNSTMYLTHYDSADNDPDPFAYVVDGGEFVQTSNIYLGQGFTSKFQNIYPGGSFVLNHGVARLRNVTVYCNQNYVKLLGGDCYAKDFMRKNPPSSIGAGKVVTNEVPYLFGAVTLHPLSDKPLAVAANAMLTGEGGDLVASCDPKTITFNAGYVLKGPGGCRKTGSQALYFAGKTCFTGALTVDQGTAEFTADSDLDGVSRLIVTAVGAKIAVKGTVTTSPEMIALAADSCLTLAAGRSLTVKRLVVGGADYEAGEYSFGSGTVTVDGAGDGVWKGADGAAWSASSSWASGVPPTAGSAVDFATAALGASGSVALDVPVSLSSLSYARLEGDGVLEMSGLKALTIADGGSISVGAGDTLVLSAPLDVVGTIRKLGDGKLVLAGGLSSDVAGVILAEAGETEVACAVSGVTVSVVSEGDSSHVTVGDGAVLSNTLVALDEASCQTAAKARLGAGTVTAAFSGPLVRDPVSLVVEGKTAFAQTSADIQTEIGSAVSGGGVLSQAGPGTLVLSGAIGSSGLSIDGGRLVIGSAAASSMDGSGTLSVCSAAGALLDLDFSGEACVKSLSVNGKGRRAGLYDATLTRVEGSPDPAAGYLHVLTDTAPGTILLIR